MKTRSLRLLSVALLLCTVVCALFVGVHLTTTQASSCSVWYHCPITQRYGQNWEHGADLWTTGKPITALRSGWITFAHEECWSGECVMDVTWRLDFPSHAGGSKFMYVQIARAAKGLHVGEHVSDWQLLGYSGSFMEIGLTPDFAYGVSNWRWGINILKVFPYL